MYVPQNWVSDKASLKLKNYDNRWFDHYLRRKKLSQNVSLSFKIIWGILWRKRYVLKKGGTTSFENSAGGNTIRLCKQQSPNESPLILLFLREKKGSTVNNCNVKLSQWLLINTCVVYGIFVCFVPQLVGDKDCNGIVLLK